MMIVVRPRRDRVERLQDLRLGAAVERAGRLVEDQDRRILEQGARDRDALLLAARQLEPALADFGVVALRQAFDEASIAAPCAAPRISSSVGAIAAIGDVVADRVVEQHRVLRDDADRGAQRGLRHLRDVLPVDR